MEREAYLGANGKTKGIFRVRMTTGIPHGVTQQETMQSFSKLIHIELSLNNNYHTLQHCMKFFIYMISCKFHNSWKTTYQNLGYVIQ